MLGFHRLERKTDPLASFPVFLRRVWRNFVGTLVIVAFSLTLGTLGYHYLGGCDWIDGFLNASMILTGMGPVTPMTTTEGKLFASFYALYSGLAFLTLVAVLLAPIYHRFLHHFHLSSEQDDPPAGTNHDAYFAFGNPHGNPGVLHEFCPIR